jgi:tRNA (guanine-N7-)-methyltransferase
MPKHLTDPAASLIYQLPSIIDRLRVPEMFPRPQPLEIELGSGDGSFVVNYAAGKSEINIIAVERLLGRLRKIDRKGRRAGLANLRGVRIEASYFLEFLTPAAAVSALHVYFPDPWPKRKHRRHRLINEHFTKIAERALMPKGVVYLRTDDNDYFAQMREVFAAATSFAEVATPDSLTALTTDFERGFNAKGIPTQRAAYQKKNATEPQSLN